MSHLLPCPSCQRHLRADETRCRFCGVSVDFSGTPAPTLLRHRYGRTLLFAFGATIGTAFTVDCGTSHPEYGAPSPPDASADDSSND